MIEIFFNRSDTLNDEVLQKITHDTFRQLSTALHGTALSINSIPPINNHARTRHETRHGTGHEYNTIRNFIHFSHSLHRRLRNLPVHCSRFGRFY